MSSRIAILSIISKEDRKEFVHHLEMMAGALPFAQPKLLSNDLSHLLLTYY
jgi:hypothetical protein